MLAVSAAAAGPLEGRWTLVEQFVGEGHGGTPDLRRPTGLAFVREGSALVGHTWFGDSGADALRWPALPTDEGRVRVGAIDVSPGEDRVRATYEVTTDADARVRLEIVEEYRVDEARGTLTGTATISLVRDGQPGGSTVVRRRFVRQP
jgi:hypothetical protein